MWFRKYGAIVIFLIMWLGSMAAHYHYMEIKTKEEAQTHQQEWTREDFHNEWLSDTFENHQSEYAQLFFQTLLVIGLGSYLMQKQEEDIKKAVKEALDERKK